MSEEIKQPEFTDFECKNGESVKMGEGYSSFTLFSITTDTETHQIQKLDVPGRPFLPSMLPARKDNLRVLSYISVLRGIRAHGNADMSSGELSIFGDGFNTAIIRAYK